MSKILDKLKEAEAQRARIMAERSQAGAAQPVAERKEIEPRTPRPTPEMHARFRAGLAIAAALGVAFWLGAVIYREPAKPMPAPMAMEAKAAPILQLDRDVDAFSARLAKGRRK